MSEDVYKRLREFLHALPGGYPETESGVEIKILRKLYTPEQAELTMKLKDEPEDASEIAKRIGMDEKELAEKLEEMAQNGLIFRVREGENRRYQAFQFLIGIYEFQLKNLDREFSELFEEYLPHYAIGMSNVKTSQMRTVPVGSVVNTTDGIATYNNVRELIKEKDFISVQQCICRKEQAFLGNDCTYPQEVCIGFGDFARYYVDNNMGRQINLDEVLKILDLAEEKGLVLRPNNAQNIDAICCCCSCCCPSLKYGKMFERSADIVVSYYVSNIDSTLCTACGECLERCPMDAIKLDDDFSEVIDGRCFGCGVCIPTCPEEAITLVAKPDMEAPPADFDETFQRIRAERNSA
jgi:NAD-dependent dihydropyrimidine dehydrogenase PreA subunit/DNA-binding Lrp family transcriptional regulator